jgi:hypothetical protein
MLRILVVASALTLPGFLAAQVEPGTRVRVATGAHTLTGRVVAAGDQTLVMERVTNRWGVPVRTRPIEWAEVRRLDVSPGRRSRAEGALHGAAVGLVGGAAGGAVMFAGFNGLSGCDPRSPDPEERFGCFRTGDALLLGAMIGAYFGAPYGAGAGFLWPGDRWERSLLPLPLPRLTVGAAPEGRVGIAASISL